MGVIVPAMPSDAWVTGSVDAGGAIPGGATADDVSVTPAGRFRVYLGAAAGVGKTCAMLDEAQRRVQRGADVVVGYVETHGRRYTAERLQGLEVVARCRVSHRGTVVEEMDLAAVLRRRPEVVLVDELAHTNVPGAGPNEKRWQDVVALLQAGIAVITTVNIQHLESIADAVEQITGAPVRERVPDWVLKRADQIELVDSSPEQLRRRILHGNVYPSEKVPDALRGFFSSTNLVALRELALRFVADQTEGALLATLQTSRPPAPFDTAERILVGVTGAPGTGAVVRRAARMAARAKADLHVVRVVREDASVAEPAEDLQQLSEDVGGRWSEVVGEDVALALVQYAREQQITQIVLGSTRQNRWRQLVQGSVIRRVLRYAAETGVDVHVIARRSWPVA